VIGRAVLTITLVVTTLSCARQIPVSTLSAVRYIPSPDTVEVPILYAAVRDDVMDQAADAMKIPRLRTTTLADGEREVRITWGGGMIWTSDPMIRLIETRSGAVGEIRRHWSLFKDSTGRAPPHLPWFAGSLKHRWRCVEINETQRAGSCRLVFSRGEPRWTEVADSLAAFGLWELPGDGFISRNGIAPPEDLGNGKWVAGGYRSDQAHVRIEVRDGSRYRSYYYYDLEQLKGNDVPVVNAILAYVRRIADQAGLQ